MRERFHVMGRIFILLGAILYTSILSAKTLTSQVFAVDGTAMGKISFEDSKYGLLIFPELTGLPDRIHGFHIHEHPDCSNHAKNAGGHLDPHNTKTHKGPYQDGHLGDLPVLVVQKDGKANLPLLAPRLTTDDIKDCAVMIHAGEDTYSDIPELGGGGSRIACGKITS